MAIVLYSNGLTEEFLSNDHTFSDKEILSLFSNFNSIQTQRLREIPNTWCVWGVYNKPLAEDYNKLGSDVLQYHCYSHILFIHDTELDPSWNLVDEIIQFGYKEFKGDIMVFLDGVALESLAELEKIQSKSGNPNIISIEQIGVSNDKRLIFNFNPDKQSNNFFDNNNFWEFAQKSYAFLKNYYRDGESFAIFADKKMIMIIPDNKVKIYIEKLIKIFENKEDYIACADINRIFKSWTAFKNKTIDKKETSKKRGRPKKKE